MLNLNAKSDSSSGWCAHRRQSAASAAADSGKPLPLVLPHATADRDRESIGPFINEEPSCL
jgi:hypothetical protein